MTVHAPYQKDLELMPVHQGAPIRLSAATVHLANGITARLAHGVWVLRCDQGLLVKVNGHPVGEAILNPGDIIEFDDQSYRIQSFKPHTAQPLNWRRIAILAALVLAAAIWFFTIGESRTAASDLAAPTGQKSPPTKQQPPATSNPAIQSIAALRSEFQIAEDLYADRAVRPQNLFLAIQKWETIAAALEIETHSTDLKSAVTDRLSHARSELTERIETLKRQAVAADRLGRSEIVQRHLSTLQLVVPDPLHPDHQWATQLLNQQSSEQPESKKTLFR